MGTDEREQRVEELREQLIDLKTVKSAHGNYLIDLRIAEIENQLAELRRQYYG